MKKGDRVIVVNSKYGMDKNLIGKKGTIVNIAGQGVFTCFVDLDDSHENNYPFFEEEIEVI